MFPLLALVLLQHAPPEPADTALPLASELAAEGRLAITAGGEPFATLRFGADLRQPCLWPVVGPGGVPLTRGWPLADDRPHEARDHPHHVSLWLAHGAVNGHDFWHGGAGERIVHRAFLRQPAASADELEVTQLLEWRTGADELVLVEERTWRFAATDTERTIDVATRLFPAGEQVVLGDTKEGTFAVRLRPELRLAGPVAAGRAFNAEGVEGADVWGERARWVAYSGPVDGAPVTVAMLDGRGNPRHPTWWHARDYGLCAANLFGVHDFTGAPAGTGELVWTAGPPLELAWSVVLRAGEATPAELDGAWERFAARTAPRRPEPRESQPRVLAEGVQPGAIAWDPIRERLIVSTADGDRALAFDAHGHRVAWEPATRRITHRLEDGTVEVLASEVDGLRDLAVRADGVIVYSTVTAESGRVVRRDVDGTRHLLWDGPPTSEPSGVALSPDGRTLYAVFAGPNVVRARTLGDGPDAGPWWPFAELGAPRWIAVGADGLVWISSGNSVIPFHPEGPQLRSPHLPGTDLVRACATGGPDGCTVFVVTDDRIRAVNQAR